MHKLAAARLSQPFTFYSPPKTQRCVAAPMVVADRDLVQTLLKWKDRRLYLSIFCSDVIDDHLTGEHDRRVPCGIDLKFVQAVSRSAEISVERNGERLLEIEALIRKLV